MLVHLRKCEDGLYCHAKLNRCKEDPHNQFEYKKPGSLCEFDSECISNFCDPLLRQCNGLGQGQVCLSD
jgi:hypothetical protein